jgi:hypothetical protein
VLVIDGKKNNNDGIGKNNNNDGMFTGKKINNEEGNNNGKQGKHKFMKRSEQYENQSSRGIENSMQRSKLRKESAV